jgi:hypothetical protein
VPGAGSRFPRRAFGLPARNERAARRDARGFCAVVVVAVDAVGSVLFGLRPGRRLIPGHGASVRPALLDVSAADRVVHVSDVECVVGCHRLVGREGILAGGSSGAIVSALEKTQTEIPDNSNCVMILPDGGDRYLDTIYSSEWVAAHFGDISELWTESVPMEVSR